MINRKILLFSFLVFALYSCEKDVDDFDKNGKVRTLNADLTSGGGVILHGELINAVNVNNHGFLIAQDTSTWDGGQGLIEMGKPQKSGAFRYERSSFLFPDRNYFYKAFIEDNEGKFYGATKSFRSKSLADPKILKIQPQKGHLEEVVSIYGKNFGFETSYTKVSFGTITATSLEFFGDTLIKVMIPANLESPDFNIKVNVFEKSVTLPYSLHKPEIHKIEPNILNIGKEFLLIGDHFDTVPERNEVFLGETKLLVNSASRKELRLIIPDEIRTTKVPIKLKAQLQEVQSPFQISLAMPKILEIPDCAETYEELLIKGENFHPNPYWNIVMFNGHEAQVIGGDEYEILIIVPRGPFPTAKAKVTVKVADLETTYSKEVCIKDDWLMISNDLPFHYFGHVGTFTLMGKAYVISNSSNYNDLKDYLWEFDPLNNTWVKNNLPFQDAYSGNTTATEEKAYIYTAHEKENFWEFNSISKQWIRKADFPGPVRGASSMFAIGGKVYVGLGRNTEGFTTISYNDFYEYNPASNSWKSITNPPANLSESSKANAVVLGEYAYVFGGATHSGMTTLARYHPATNTWTTLADMPYAMNFMAGFAWKGRIYGATGNTIGGSPSDEVWIYDPMKNTWENGASMGKIGRYRAFSFVVNDQVFMGGGEGTYMSMQIIGEFFKLMR
jgi:hypothetical protein